jgi:hypothetical protein
MYNLTFQSQCRPQRVEQSLQALASSEQPGFHRAWFHAEDHSHFSQTEFFELE